MSPAQARSRTWPSADKTVILLPLVPPSVNRIWRTGKNRSTGKPVTYRDKSYTAWIDAVGLYANRQAVSQKRWAEPVHLDIAMRRPRKNADLDNRLKATVDLLESLGVIANDKLVTGISARWAADIEGVSITITAAERAA